MNIAPLDKLGDWNPQLLRELKGRLRPRNILIALPISLLGQLLLLMSFASQLPTDDATASSVYSKYCLTRSSQYGECVPDALGHFPVNWQQWWLDVFVWLSIFGFVALLVVGTHLLISDLSREEQRGTLNFIRLSPQSTTSVLSGKLLGVPILLYLVAALALPLHLWAAFQAEIPATMILGFYGVVAASCACFYSIALIYGLVSAGIGGFQAWLGSGAMLLLLYILTALTMGGGSALSNTSGDWLHLFSPLALLPYLMNASIPVTETYSAFSQLSKLTWFNLPIGASFWSMASFSALNCGLWAYLAWQALKRCFHNPSATLLSKRQSYSLTACFEVLILGFALQTKTGHDRVSELFNNFTYILILNLFLFAFLMAALSPHRQAIQDWARYRRERKSSRLVSRLQNLVWGEKSPALVAVGLNLAIAVSMLVPWIWTWPGQRGIQALVALLLTVNLFLIYASIAQLMLFMQTQKRALWAATTVTALIVLPPIIFGLLSLSPEKVAAVWLFSAFPWAAVKEATSTTVIMTVMSQWLMLALLNIQTTRQLRLAGESATKALMEHSARSGQRSV